MRRTINVALTFDVPDDSRIEMLGDAVALVDGLFDGIPKEWWSDNADPTEEPDEPKLLCANVIDEPDGEAVIDGDHLACPHCEDGGEVTPWDDVPYRWSAEYDAESELLMLSWQGEGAENGDTYLLCCGCNRRLAFPVGVERDYA